jgi:hypothetical protein
MKSKWKATVSNPLGEEIYDMTIETVDSVTQAHVANEKGNATFTQVDLSKPLILSASLDVPMRTKVNLEFLTDDYHKHQTFNAILTIGEFSTMSVKGVKYE